MNKNVNMCDLIDLNSPDRKGLLSSRLASPLIPVPADMACGNYNNHINEPRSLVIGKRDSLENNPFDMVLHKTTEYIQKKHDPFEVTLEKALRPKCKKNIAVSASSANFTDDNIIKQKKCSQKLKMNRTLDDKELFHINKELNQKNVTTNKILDERIVVDLNNTNILNDDLKSDNINSSPSKNIYNAPAINVQNNDLSILNQSIMNDTLFEADKELRNEHMKSTSQNKVDLVPKSTTFLKIPKLRRCFSQGEKIQPKISHYLDQISVIEPLPIECGNSSSVSSLHSLNVLNDGFLNSSGSSVFSGISSISSITKLNSVSSITQSSMMLSNGTINRTFLESCSSEKSDNTNLSEKIDFVRETNSALPTSKSSITLVTNISNKSQSVMSDLTERFNKLKTKTSELDVLENSVNENHKITSSFSNDVKECVTVMEKSEECNTNNKLIDVDIFTPEMNCSKEQCKSSISDTSSDSVFLEGNKINRSIFHEAKLLARTFEELALRTSSGSSIDDLITNNPSWTLELLPAFDDEAMVDNLIELPTSPIGNNINSRNEKIMECTDNDSHANENGKLITNEVDKNIKDLEMELIEPILTEKRISAATLLLDLKKLITTEKNIEANKLLENLEKVLGINLENNTELLTTYFNATNNLAKSPQKSSGCLKIKNVAENNMEYSQEDNLTSDLPEDTKESAICTNMNFNDSSISKCSANNQKNLKEINSESKKDNVDMKTSTEKINKEMDKNTLNIQNVSTNDSSYKTDSNNSLNEKVAMELLTNLGKLLTGQTEEHSTLNLLKNLGKVLNFASNNCNVGENIRSDINDVKIQQSPKKSNLKFESKTRTSVLSKSVNRLSLDLDSKKQPLGKNFIRRSISVSQTPPIKNTSPLMSKDKTTSKLKEVTKRFPSDPGLISSTSNKKVIANNNKNDLGKGTKTITTLDSQKEKPTVMGTVKTKLKKKIGGDIVYKKGPLKAILPIGSMQKGESISKKVTLSAETVTPPKSHKIISSTPNSTDNRCTAKKSIRSSKPVASSTPDAQNSKTHKIQSQITNCSKKRNFSCDISPVTTRVNVSNNNGINSSPRRLSKLPSPKKTTPKRRPADSSIPKSQTPPISKRLNSSFDVNQYDRLSESPQRSLHKLSHSQKSSPVSLKKNSGNTQQSPLRDNNKIVHKVKPINLISKLRRHSISTNVMEKENNYI